VRHGGRRDPGHGAKRFCDLARTAQRWISLTEVAKDAGDHSCWRPEIQRHQPRARGELVAECLGRDVCLGGAAQEAQERHVVDRPELLLAQSQRVAETGGQDTGAQGVLDRLAHAEVGGQRQRRDYLCQADWRFASLVHTYARGDVNSARLGAGQTPISIAFGVSGEVCFGSGK
jgi:hypothetical protein